MISCMTELSGIAQYLKRIGAEPRSLRVAVVKEVHGAYWQDVATIRIKKDGSIDAPEGYAPTEDEAVTIKSQVVSAEWPNSVKLGTSYELPEELKGCKPDDLFEMKDRNGKLVMIHQRITIRKTGEKRYQPWSYWSDKQWRKMEPEGNLPLFGLETLGDNTTVFLHEGAKAARHMQRMIDPRTAEEKEALKNHPWGEELQGAAHLGWIGGALSPLRTDWSELTKAGVTRAYIVADNDRPGKAAIPRISQQLRGMTVFSVEFTEVWPASFDLADDFPANMFKKIGSTRHYNGPSFRDVLHPATWATDMVPIMENKKVKMVPTLRKEFIDLWVWSEQTDTFLGKEMPEIEDALAQFNAMVRPFSHISTTGQALHGSYKGRTAKLCYRPDVNARIVTDRSSSAINLHTPPQLRPIKGDVAPWLEFLD